MDMSVETFRLGIQGWGGGGESPDAFSVLSLGAEAGPDSLRINWGAPDLFDREAAVVTYAPQPDGSFNLPGPGTNHAYADGSYLVRATAYFGASTLTDTLRVFVDANDTAGTTKSGSGLTDVMFGGSGGDSFSGLTGDDLLAGGGGDDLLNGGNGNDTLSCGDGNDTALGGAGNDVIFGDAGDDSLSGGAGADQLGGGVGADIVNGGDGDDRIFGDDGLFGGGPEGGNDTLNGGNGNDTMDGELGDDSLNGGAGDDDLTGGDGDDTIQGGEGDDYLYGNAGADRLIGGAGSDSMYGGMGSDTLVSQADGVLDLFTYLDASEGVDRIIGFEAGIDKIFLNFLDGSQMDPSHFVNSPAAMTDTGPYIIYNATNGQLRVDFDGTVPGSAVLIATLVGAPSISFDDFWFGSLA